MPGFSLFPRKRRSAFQLAKLTISIAIVSTVVTAVAKGATIEVPSGGDFQAALNVANCGDTIVLQAGGSYIVSLLEQPFVAKAKGACTGTDADFITIQSSNSSALPSSLRDLSVSQIRALSLPKLITKVSTPALEFQAGSHHYRFLGIEITNDSLNKTLVNNGLVFAGIQHGSSSNITLATVPRKIEFDRTWVHGEEDGTDSTTATCLRAFWLGAAEFTIKNSRLGGFRVFYPGTQGPGASTHGVLIEKGPGPYVISNNYIEAWFASIFTGGGPQWITNQATVAPGATTTQATMSNVNNLAIGDYIAFRVTGQGSHYQVAKVAAINGNTVTYVPQGGLDGPGSGNPLVVPPETPGDAVWNGDTPKNLTITNNVFWKNPVVGAAAAALGYYGKGHMEFKTATDTLVEGNDFSGYASGFTITSRNQSSEFTSGNNPWATITNLTFRNNRWRGDFRPGTGAVIGIQLNDNNATTVPGRNVTFDNMLFENLWVPLLSIAGSPNVTFKHVTALGGTPTDDISMIGGYSQVSPGFRLEDNIFQNNEYGLNCSLGPTAACYPNYVMSGNVFLDNRSAAKKISSGPLSNQYPAGNYYPDLLSLLQFVDISTSNWGLAATSPYKALGSNGTDPGVNMSQLLAAMGGILPPPPPTPTPTPTPSPTPTPPPSHFQLSSPSFHVFEGGGSAHVTVERTNSTGAASVDYRTSDSAGLIDCNLVNGVASARCDYTIAVGTLRFAPGENAKSISIPIVDDGYAEQDEDFNITLSDANGATLGSPSVATITIQSNATNGPNPIDRTAFFVRQQYLDFLNREPDPGGYEAWQQIINNCGEGDTRCDRIQVSSAFFSSAEFQDRGYFVYRFYPVSFGRKPDYAEFTPDIAKVSGFLTDAELDAAKVAFIAEFMSRPEFVTKFNGLTDTQYVDTLLETAGIISPNRDFWIEALGNGTRTRATVLRDISESNEVYISYYNQAFVVMQYFGYLRRDPDASYIDWIQVLNSSGDFRAMVDGFINSLEYRSRLGS